MASRTACLIVLAFVLAGPAVAADKSPQPAKKAVPASKPKVPAKPAKAQPAKGKTQAAGAPWEADQRLGDEQLKLGKYEDAVASFGKAVAAAKSVFSGPLSPDSGKAMLALSRLHSSQGHAYLKLGKDDEAISAYEKAAEYATNKREPYFSICSIEYRLGRLERVRKDCARAIAADPAGVHAAEAKKMLEASTGK